MRNLEIITKQIKERIQKHLEYSPNNRNNISYDSNGNKYWRGKKLVSIWDWSLIRCKGKFDLDLQYMPEKFEYGPLPLSLLQFNDFREYEKKAEKWLQDYYDYLIFIEDKTEDDIWKHIAK